jgi:hypothetical protein
MLSRIRSLYQRFAPSRIQGAGSVEDRRTWDRLPVERDVTIHVGPSDLSPITGRMRDVSRGGIRLVIDRRVESGTMIRVELPLPADRPGATVLACVVHVGPAEGPGYEIGCSFATELSDAELEALGAKRVRAKEGDKRAWSRVPSAGHVVYTRVQDTPVQCRAGIHNISPTGVAILAEEELTPGHLLEIELKNSAGRTVLAIVACIVYASKVAEGRWLIGCNFIHELSDDEFQAVASGGR